MLERIMGILILLIAFCGMIMSCSMRNSSESDRLVVAGVLANSILVVYYTSPLSTMFEVFRTRDSKSMHFPLVLCNCLNGVCWTSYGIALDDWWIAAPNLFGSMLSLVQLCMMNCLSELRANSATDSHVLGGRLGGPRYFYDGVRRFSPYRMISSTRI